MQNFRSKVDIGTDYISSNIRIIEPDADNFKETNLQLIIKKHLVILINISDSLRNTDAVFYEAIHRYPCNEYTVEKFIYAFFDCLIQNDNRNIEDIEIGLNKIENSITNDSMYKNFNEVILRYKKKLLHLKNYYEQLIDIAEALFENENGIFLQKNLIYFRRIILKTERLCDNVNLLRENLVQLRELYQSSIDLRLNNTMKLFTVLTAVFSPLTLITGWYGMNFTHMPELTWKYGYIYVISLALSILALCIYFFRKNKLI